jgi:hypothetical protein
MNTGAQFKVVHNSWRHAFTLVAALLTASTFYSRADAGPLNLITDGTFQGTQNGLQTPGGYLCQNGGNAGHTCVSNLTYWTPTCSATGCSGSSTPSSLLYINAATGDAYANSWNGGLGLYPTIVAPPGGSNVIAIDGGSAYSASISQTISGLSVGSEYVLSFYQGAAQQKGFTTATTEQWQVTFGSNSQTSLLMNNAPEGVVPWNEVTMSFLATSASETLTFLALGTPAGEPPVVLLADVDMFLPEPGSLAMLGAGMLGLVAARWRRSRSLQAQS